jgi:hypothetical protein
VKAKTYYGNSQYRKKRKSVQYRVVYNSHLLLLPQNEIAKLIVSNWGCGLMSLSKVSSKEEEEEE